jgi:hypothetical protein
MKRLTSIHISELTDKQIEQLKTATGLNQSEVITTAIDRMAREEIEMKRVTISAEQKQDGTWSLIASNGDDLQQDGYTSEQAAINAAKILWPTNSVWRGKAIGKSWSIDIA